MPTNDHCSRRGAPAQGSPHPVWPRTGGPPGGPAARPQGPGGGPRGLGASSRPPPAPAGGGSAGTSSPASTRSGFTGGSAARTGGKIPPGPGAWPVALADPRCVRVGAGLPPGPPTLPDGGERTVEVFLECTGNSKLAAEKLFIHPTRCAGGSRRSASSPTWTSRTPTAGSTWMMALRIIRPPRARADAALPRWAPVLASALPSGT